MNLQRKCILMKKSVGNKSTRDKSLIRLPKSPAIMASGISTIFIPENSKENYGRLNLLLHEKQAGKNSKIFNKEFVAIVDKLLEYNFKSMTQHKFLLSKCLN